MNKIYKTNIQILFLVFLFLPKTLMGAACCGSGSSLPSLITGDVRTQFNFSMTRSKLLGKQLPHLQGPIWNDSEENKTQRIFLQGSYLFDNFFQIGLGLPYFFKQSQESGLRKTGQHIGDIEFQVAYELLPEAFYSEWLPRIFIFSKLTIPTGFSIYETLAYNTVDITGQGHTSLSFGTLVLKEKGANDFQFLAEIHKGLEQRFNKNLEPGFPVERFPKFTHRYIFSDGNKSNKFWEYVGNNKKDKIEYFHVTDFSLDCIPLDCLDYVFL